MSIKPITPSEMEGNRKWPDGVIEAWNTVIAAHWNGSYSKFSQDTIRQELAATMGVLRRVVSNTDWLHVESTYRDAGWSVEYIADDTQRTFTFRRPK